MGADGERRPALSPTIRKWLMTATALFFMGLGMLVDDVLRFLAQYAPIVARVIFP